MKTLSNALTLVAVLLGVLLPVCSAVASDTDDSPVLATWNDGKITQDELASWQAFQTRGRKAGSVAAGPASEAPQSAETSQASQESASEDAAGPAAGSEPGPSEESLRELAFWKILAASAEEAHLDTTPRVRFAIEATRQAILAPILRDEIVSKVTVSDDEVEALRKAHPEAFHRPRKLKLRNIYLRFTTPDQAPAIRRHMEEIHQELENGASFADLAEQESESQSAPRGGAIGWVDPEKLPPAVTAAVRGLKPGEITPPVEHGEGISLFLCEEVREGHVPSADEVRTKIRTQLERTSRRKAWDDFEQSLLDKAAPKIDPEASTTVLSLPGYHLSADDFAVLVKAIPAGAVVTPNAQQRKSILETWARHVVEVQRAIELGLDQRPDVARALRWKRLETLAQAELARRLQEMLPEPTEKELHAEYESRRRKLTEPGAFDLEAIFFGKAEGEGGRALVERATKVVQQIASGELSFGDAARKYSKLPSAAAGGALGWVTTRQVALWGPTVSGAIRNLEPGQTTELLHRESGLWVYALLGTREARSLPFEEVEPQLHKMWAEKQVPDLAATLRRQELERAGFALHPADAPKPPVVRWSTAAEFESYGFNVYRATSADGPFERVTDEPIPGAGTSSVPHAYRFEDHTAKPGVVYYYYVEEISTSGRARRLTPIRASNGGTG